MFRDTCENSYLKTLSDAEKTICCRLKVDVDKHSVLRIYFLLDLENILC